MKKEFLWFETAFLDWGGGPRFMFNVARYLSTKNWQVDFVIFSMNANLKGFVEGTHVKY